MIPFSSFVKAFLVTLVLTGLGLQSLGAADGRVTGSRDEEEYNGPYWARFMPEPTPEMPEPWRIKEIMEYIREEIGPKKYSLSIEESERLKDELIPHITPDSERFNRVFQSVRASIEEEYWNEYYEFNVENRDLWSWLKVMGFIAFFPSVANFFLTWAQEGYYDEKGASLYERLGPYAVFSQQLCFVGISAYELARVTRAKMCPPRRQYLSISSEDKNDIYLSALIATSLYIPLMDRYRGREHTPTPEAKLSLIIEAFYFRSTSAFKPKGHNAAFWVLNKFPELCTKCYSEGY